MKHEEGHLVGFPIKKGLTYRKRKGHEYCVVVATVYSKHDMCEYIAANTTEEVFSRDVTFDTFIKEFEPTQLGFNEVLTMLKNRTARAGATERAQYLLDFLIAQISEGEVEMATEKKKSPVSKQVATTKKTKDVSPYVAATGKRGRKSNFLPDMKIKVLVKENPKREGSASYARFAHYFNSKSVADFIAAGGTYGDIKWDIEHNFISVV